MCIFAAAGAAAGAAGAAAGGMGSFMAIAQIGLGLAQAAMSQQAANAQYQQQLQYRQEQAIQNQKTLNQQVTQQQAALESEKNKAQGELAEAAIQTNQKRSYAATNAAESGVTGLSVSFLDQAIQGEGGRFKNRISYNSKMAQANAENELKMAQRGAQARLAEIPIPVKPANTFLIDAGSSILSGIGTAYQYRNA